MKRILTIIALISCFFCSVGQNADSAALMYQLILDDIDFKEEVLKHRDILCDDRFHLASNLKGDSLTFNRQRLDLSDTMDCPWLRIEIEQLRENKFRFTGYWTYHFKRTTSKCVMSVHIRYEGILKTKANNWKISRSKVHTSQRSAYYL